LKQTSFYLLAIALGFFACSKQNQSAFIDLETIRKDETFRANIKTGAFVKLSAGYTYYEYTNPNADTLLVLVHGFSVPSYIWDSTYQAAVKRGYGALRYDNFGRGNSDNPDVVYDAALFSNQLKELLDALNIAKPIHLVGLSDGGRTISAFAFQYPEKIKSLTYVDAVGFETLPDTAAYPAQVTEEEILTFKQKRYPTMAQGQMTDFYDSIPFRGWDKQYTKLMAHQGFVRALISTNKNRRNLEREHQKIVSSGIPVFAIWGESDTVVPLNDMRDAMLKRMPAIKLFVIPKAGHLPHMEQAAQFNSILFGTIIKNLSALG
jgi:pimeloyl-ACP methyl ester carboxylesterase